jgi:Domain of Unknown Function (DUF1080)
MRALVRDLILLVVATGTGFSVTDSTIHLLRSPSRGLPYHDAFGESENSEWAAYDGNWTVRSGVMVNESNERGAKLVTGSPYWTDYALDADISLSSTGDAGLIARLSDAEPGVDSYRGMYVGLRVRDEALVFGVADHSWTELAAKPLPFLIIPGVWYHIGMKIEGCHVSISAYPDGNKNNIVRQDESLSECPERGKIGLRSYDSGGRWRNIRVTSLKP